MQQRVYTVKATMIVSQNLEVLIAVHEDDVKDGDWEGAARAAAELKIDEFVDDPEFAPEVNVLSHGFPSLTFGPVVEK